ncbi:hypothetical protein AOLI_G00091270 [Acnodon oligacanthus]
MLMFPSCCGDRDPTEGPLRERRAFKTQFQRVRKLEHVHQSQRCIRPQIGSVSASLNAPKRPTRVETCGKSLRTDQAPAADTPQYARVTEHLPIRLP